MDIKALIIHADKFVERKLHMDRMLSEHTLSYDYVIKGAGDHISEEERNKYMEVDSKSPKMSMGAICCTLQHFYAYEKIVEENLPGALILEDDAMLSSRFDTIFPLTIEEYSSCYSNENVIISYEDSRLRFVPCSKREKGRFLYPMDRDRMAGIYFININAARMILDDACTQKCKLAIDLYHSQLLEQGKLTYLWCQPTIASQGSFVGILGSTLSTKKIEMEKLRWKILRTYKKLLYQIR